MSSTTATPDWNALRADWPHVAEGLVWLQHAGIAPPCRRVLDVAIKAMNQFAVAPQLAYTGLWFECNEGARRKVASFLGAPERNVALVKNTSQGVICVAESFPFAPGDNVVTLGGEYPANRLPWRVLERKGVEVRSVLPDPAGRFPVDRVAPLLDARTRVVAVSWVQYLNGFRCDLAALAELCERVGAYLVVDAVQGVGLVPLDLAGVDAAAVGGHKWMCGTEGAGFLYLSDRLLDRLGPFNVSWKSVADELAAAGREVMVEDGLPALKAGAERFEEGTPNAYGNVMLGEAATMLGELGPERMFARVLGLQDYLLDRLAGRGYVCASSLAPGERSGILALNHPAHPADALVSALKAARIVAIRRGDNLRLAPHCYNNEADMDRVVEALL